MSLIARTASKEKRMTNVKRNLLCFLLIGLPIIVGADDIEFSDTDFTVTPTFSEVVTFNFVFELRVAICAGKVYSNPKLNSVVYNVSGVLHDTPSGFPAFGLERTIGGEEFYLQGSSIDFEVDVAADFSDGLQVSELAGDGLVFEINARELGTGRYHPPLFRLNSDGTGSIRNSNNQGGINPGNMMEVDIDFGEEYITELSFDATTLTLIGPPGDCLLADGFE
jgi:hypothetical protein